MPIFFRAFSRASIRPLVANEQKTLVRWPGPKTTQNPPPPQRPVPKDNLRKEQTLSKRPFCFRLLGGNERFQVKSCMAESLAGLGCKKAPTWADINKHIGALRRTYSRNISEKSRRSMTQSTTSRVSYAPSSGEHFKAMSVNLMEFYDQISIRKKMRQVQRTQTKPKLNIFQVRNHLRFLLSRLKLKRRRSMKRSPKNSPILPQFKATPTRPIRKFLLKRPRRKRRHRKTQDLEEIFHPVTKNRHRPRNSRIKHLKKHALPDDPVEVRNYLSPNKARSMNRYRKKMPYQATKPPIKTPKTLPEAPRKIYRKPKLRPSRPYTIGRFGRTEERSKIPEVPRKIYGKPKLWPPRDVRFRRSSKEKRIDKTPEAPRKIDGKPKIWPPRDIRFRRSSREKRTDLRSSNIERSKTPEAPRKIYRKPRMIRSRRSSKAKRKELRSPETERFQPDPKSFTKKQRRPVVGRHPRTIPDKPREESVKKPVVEERTEKEKRKPSDNIQPSIKVHKKSSWVFEKDALAAERTGGKLRRKFIRRAKVKRSVSPAERDNRELSSDSGHRKPAEKVIRRAKAKTSSSEAQPQTGARRTPPPNPQRRKLIRRRSTLEAPIPRKTQGSAFKLGEGLKIKDYGFKKTKKAVPPPIVAEPVQEETRSLNRSSFRTLERPSYSSARSAASSMFGKLTNRSREGSVASREDTSRQRSQQKVQEEELIVPPEDDSPGENDEFFERIKRNLYTMTNSSKPSLRDYTSLLNAVQKEMPLHVNDYPSLLDGQDPIKKKKRIRLERKRKKKQHRLPPINAKTQTKCICGICHYLQKFRAEKLPPIYAEVANRQKDLKHRQYYMDHLRHRNFSILDSYKAEIADDSRPIISQPLLDNTKVDCPSKPIDPYENDFNWSGKNIYMNRSLPAACWSLSSSYAHKTRILDDYKAPNVSKIFQLCYRTLFEADQQTTNLSANDCQFRERLCCA
ncbi:uncharacterized protein Dana_GF27442 [Drosophila ananassae]|uniref:Uncharacterized protein n=1 Tax=Drosophila ananassae TaxID=7217 RepID=A0A0P8XR59_DROAN|nr:serine/arginine repetitive matrix protein 1 [Drosophila ananassae]KPU77048.1 uncharacterized protein Dana_GF27442 [Drosophila ananassae]